MFILYMFMTFDFVNNLSKKKFLFVKNIIHILFNLTRAS